MYVVLRPGPYICGERDWGGFPAWLSTIPGLTVRTYNEPYLNHSTRYLERLAADLQHLQVTKGGPLLMVQVENEVSETPHPFPNPFLEHGAQQTAYLDSSLQYCCGTSSCTPSTDS